MRQSAIFRYFLRIVVIIIFVARLVFGLNLVHQAIGLLERRRDEFNRCRNRVLPG